MPTATNVPRLFLLDISSSVQERSCWAIMVQLGGAILTEYD